MSKKLTIYLPFTFILVSCACLAAVSSAYGEDDSQTTASQLAEEQVKLEQSRSELAVLDIQIAAQEQYVEQNRDQLAEARMLLRDAEDRYRATLELYEERIKAIYKMGNGRFYSVLLDSDGVTDAATRISYMSQISENDAKLVHRVKYEAAEVRRLHSQVDEIKQANAGELEELEQRRLEIEGSVSTSEEAIDRHMDEIAEAEAREMEQVAQTAGSEPGVSIYDSLMSPSVLIGSSQPPPGYQSSGVVLRGVASWYGPGFHGNHTANGELYDMFAYTAAHKTLHFGTWLKVTHNGRSVFVRINDRGPYIGGRFLDLSAAASRAIGMTGIGYVTAEVYR